MKKTVIAALILAALPAASFAADEHTAMRPDALKWGAAPPAFPPGSEVAVLAGDPNKEGSAYVVRVRTPAGYTVPPHTHPADENITVVSGMFHIAMGGKLDTSKGDALPAGSFIHMAKDTPHYAWSPAAAIIQLHGIGPMAITYVDPADDPRNKATTGTK
jgi:quercetin dioxygenase-like cupin family protein